MTSEGNDAYLNDISYQCDSPVLNNEKSKVAEFFAHTNVLVTGGTGFLGKLLVEKLLRSCPDITTLYMMVRPKKGKSSEERFKATFEDAPFDKLRREQPDFTKKVIMIEGDATQEGFGLTPESKEILMNTNIIFHAAATVRFDEKFRLAVNINVKAIKYLLLFAKQLPDLRAFVHVSTAYSNCTQKFIDEVHYQPPMDGDKLLTVVDTLDDEKLAKIAPILIADTPNTYIFTKAVGESIVRKYGEGLPVCIVRPSIVLSTHKEPIAGWINNLYGATGVAVGAAIGLLRTLYCIPEKTADIIPADYVVATTVAAAWDVNDRRSKKLDQDSNASADERIPIYNCVSSCQRPISWGAYMYKTEEYGLFVPPSKSYWYYVLILNRYLFLHNLCVFFFHLVPAAIIDTIMYLSGQKPMLLDIYKKIGKFSSVIHYFSTQEWTFRNENILNLWRKLNSRDRKIFNINIDTLDWEDFFYHYIRGVRVYVYKDPLDTINEGLARHQKLRIIHYTTVTLISLLLLWGAVSLFSFLWSLCPLAH